MQVVLVIKQRLTYILTQTLLYYLNIFRPSGVCLLMCICNIPVLFLISPPFSLYPLDKNLQKYSQTISIIPPFVGELQLFGRKLLLKVPVLGGQLTIFLEFCNGPCHTHYDVDTSTKVFTVSCSLTPLSSKSIPCHTPTMRPWYSAVILSLVHN